MKTKVLLSSKRSFVRSSIAILLIMILSITTAMAANRYSVVATGLWSATSTWSATPTGSGGASIPAAGDAVYIQDGNTITISAANTTALLSLSIASGGTLSVTSTRTVSATTITIEGTYTNGSTGAITVTNWTCNGTYNHNTTMQSLPKGTSTSTWGANSNLNINGFTGTTAVNLANFMNQTFGHVTFNCTGITSGSVCLITENGATTIQGNFTVTSMGSSGTLFMRKTNVQFAGELTINGNFTLTSGILDMHNGGGTITNSIINLAGNFTMTGGTLTETTTSASRIIFNFTKIGTQIFSRTSGTISSAASGPGIQFIVQPGSILDMGTSVLTGTNLTSFTLSAGAGIITANTNGLTSSGATGSIQVASTRTYSASADYTFNSLVATQVTGNGVTGANNLTFNNTYTTGVTFSNAIAVTGTMAIATDAHVTLGSVNSSAAALTLGGTTQATGTSYGGTGSGANHVNTTYFNAATGLLTVSLSAPSNLSYNSPNAFPLNVTITNLLPTVTGVVTSYGISPSLPTGLDFNTTTGVISGTPSANSPSAVYTVTATNSSGSTTFGVVISVGNYRYAVNASSAAWNLTSTWSETSGGPSGATVPVAGDIVYIGDAGTNRTVTIPSGYDAVCGSLIMGNRAAATIATLTFTDGTSTLNVGGDLVMNRPSAAATSVITVGAGSLTVGGMMELSFFIGLNETTSCINQVTLSTGTVTVGSLVFYGSVVQQAQVVFSGVGTLNIGGALTLTNGFGTLTPSTGTVNFNGSASAQTIPIGVSSVTYNNLTVNNTSTNGATLSAAISTSNVFGNLSVGNVSSGSKLNNNGFAIVLASNKSLNVANGCTLNLSGTTTMVSVSGTGTKTFGATSTVKYSGKAQTVTAESYGHLTLSGGATKTMPASTLNIAGNFTMSDTASATALAVMNISGNVSLGSVATFNASTFTHTVGGNWTNSGATFTAGTGTINFNGAGAGNIGASNFNNVTFSGAGAKTATGALTIAGNVSITGNFTGGSYTHTVSGNWANSGTFTATGSTIDFNGSGAGNIGACNFDNVTFSGAGTKTATGALTITGDVSITGNFTAGAFTHTVGGNWTKSGSFTATGSTVDFNGADAGNIGAGNFNHLIFSGAGTKSATGAISVNGNVTISNNFSGGSYTHTISGDWTNNGTFTANTSTVTFIDGTSSAIGGTSSTTFNNLTINGTGGAALGIAATVSGTLTLTTGKLDIGNYNLTVGSSGSISGGSSTSYVKTSGTGRLKQSVPGNHTVTKNYPVGNSAYNPMTVTYNDVSTSENFSIRVVDGNITNANSTKTVNRKWYFIMESAGSADLTISATYNTGEEGSGFSNSTTPKIGFFDGTSWAYREITSGSGTTTFTAAGSAPDFSNTNSFFALGSGDAFAATKLAVTNINPATPTKGVATSGITVQAQNSNSIPTMVNAATGFDLTCANTLMSTSPSGTISQYTYQTIVSSVTFTESTWDLVNSHYDSDATVTATRTSGDVLTAGTSVAFDVYDGYIYEPVASGSTWSTVTWKSSVDGGSTWTDPATLPSGNNFANYDLIRIPSGITLTADVTASFYSMVIYGTLDINSSGALTLNHSLLSDYNIYVTGTLKNSGGTITNTNTAYPLEIKGGTYWHNMAGGSVPVCTFSSLGATKSTCVVNGTGVGGLNQVFENFTLTSGEQTLSGDMTINGALTLTAGKITTGSYRVIVGLDGTASNTGAGWINGTLRRYVASTVTTGAFPVGDATTFAPFSIACTGTPSGNGYLDVSTVAAQPPSASGLSQTKYINRKWTISNNGVSGITSYAPSCTFADGDKIGTPAEGNLRLRKLTASKWYTTNGAASGNTITATALSTAGLYAASDFYAGEDDCSSTVAVWLGSSSTDWNTPGNWCSGSVPTDATDVTIPSSVNQPVVGIAGGTCKNITIGSGAILTFSGAYTLDVHGNWSNSGTLTAGTGTVSFTGSAAQAITGATIFNNLVINNATGVTASSDFTVNGLLSLTSANPDATHGALDMGSYTLSMLDKSASVTGIGDVTGIVKRHHTFTPNTQYQFGSEFTTINFMNTGTQPDEISCKISIGATPIWKTGAVQRFYSFAQPGTSFTDKVTVNLRYLDGELNGNDETKLVIYDKHVEGALDEHGKSNNNTTNNWVGLSGLSINYVARTSLDNRVFGLANYSATKNTWTGASNTDWAAVENWTGGHAPLPTEDVLIPDVSLVSNRFPVLSSDVEIKTIEIATGATLTAGDYDITINGYSGAWQNSGTFYPGTGAVNVTHGNLNRIVTVSGTTQFHDINIAANTFVKPATGCVMKISGLINGDISCIVDLSSFENTLEYNGTDQYFVNPATTGFDFTGYYNLVISGTGTKTLYGGNQLDISGDFTNNGTLDISTATVSFIGTTPQAISGSTATPFNNLTINNASGVTSATNLTVNGELNLQSANPDASHGSLHMGSNVLSLGIGSTVTGTGDVTGTVKRSHEFQNDVFYAYSSANHGVTFTGLPDQTGNPLTLYIKTEIGTAPDWSACTGPYPLTSPARRVYTIWQAGTSWGTTKGFFRARFLPSEIPDGVNLSNLTIWAKIQPDATCTIADLGKSNIDLVNYYVSIGNIPVSIFPTTDGPRQITLAPTAATVLTWNGIYSIDMTDPDNWTPNYAPSSSYGLIIPDDNTTAFSPELSGTVTCKSILIESSGVLNSNGASNLVLTGTGLVWAGEPGAVFNNGSSTVTINCATPSSQSNIAGLADFNNLTIASGTTLVPAADCYIRINGVLTNSGYLYADITENTIDYCGNNYQTIIVPDAGYRSLVLSGSGEKVFAGKIFVSADFTNNCSGIVYPGEFEWFPEALEADEETIGGTYPTTFNSLTINSTVGLRLLQNVTVNFNLRFTNGMLALGNYDLVMGTSGLILGSTSDMYVITDGTGSLQRIVVANETDVTYPIGLATEYLPVKIHFTEGSTYDNIKVRVANGLNTDYNSSDEATGTPITTGAVNKAWFLNEAIAGGSNATVTVQWNLADEASFSRAKCDVAHYTGGAWAYTAGTAATTVSTGVYSQAVSGITSFSPFGVFGQTLSNSVNGTTFCAGDAVSVDYVATGGSWNSGNVFTAQLSNGSGSFASPVTIGTVTSTTSGTISATIPAGATDGTAYRIRVISDNPAGDGSDNGSNITINALPAISAIAGGQAGVCVNSQTAAFTNATEGGIWSIDAGTGTANITSGGVVTGLTAGSVDVRYTTSNGSGCTSSVTQALTVYALPTISDIAGGSTNVCVGSQTPAFTNATGGGTWSIVAGTGTASIDEEGVVTGLTAGSVTVKYTTAANGNGCINFTTQPLTVDEIPTVDPIGGGQDRVCVNATTVAFTDATEGGTWSIVAGTGAASINSGGIVTGTSAGTVTVKYTTAANGSGCVNYATHALTVDELPTVAAIAGGQSAVCVNAETAAFTDATEGGTWSIVAGTGTASITTGGVVTGLTAGSVTVNYTTAANGNGCENFATQPLTVEALPTVAAIAGGQTNVCVNASTVAFTDATEGGSWSIIPGTGTASVTAGGVVTGLTAGNVTVKYTTAANGAGCVNFDTEALTVDALPEVAAIGGGQTRICVNSSTVAFTDATPGGSWSIVPGTGTASITAGGVVTGLTAGIVNVKYTTAANGAGCVNFALKELTIDALPEVAPIMGGQSHVCVDDVTAAFTDATFGGIWSIVAGTGTASITQEGIVTGISAGTVSVKYTTGTKGPLCQNYTTKALTVDPLPGITTTGTVAAVCYSAAGQTTTLAYSASTGLPTSYSINWSGFDDQNHTDFAFIPGGGSLTGIEIPAGLAPGEYSGVLILETDYICTSGVNISLFVNNLPTITTAGTAATACYNAGAQTTTLAYSATTYSPTSYSIDWNAAANAAGLDDQGSTSYSFLSGGGTLPGIAITAGTLAGGPYSGTMTITNANGCTATQEVSLTINARRTISGTVNYYNSAGNILMTDQNVTVNAYLTSDGGHLTSMGSDVTDASGNYEITNLCPSCDYDIVATSSHTTIGAVNTTDAAQVNYYGAHGLSIEKTRFYAGDVSRGLTLNATDAQQIQANFVHGTAFARGTWTFWKANDPIWSNTEGVSYLSVNLAVGTDLTVNLYGLVTGDFNRSFSPAEYKSASSTLDLIYAGNRMVGSNQEFDLPIAMVNAGEVGAISLILDFPAELAEVTGVSMGNADNQPDWAVNGNELRIGWSSLEALNLVAGNELLTLRMKTSAAFTTGNSIKIALASNPLNELADGQYNVIGDAVLGVDIIEASSIGVGEQPGKETISMSNYPNPFTDFTTIRYTLPFNGKVILEVSDVLGNKVAVLLSETQTAGKHEVKFNTYGLPSGVYFATMKLQSDDNELIRTIKLINNK